MPALSSVVKVNITTVNAAVAQASFAVPLILGPTAVSWAATDKVHSYTSAAGLLTDGYTTSSPEYVYASSMFAQNITPSVIKVGKRGAATGNEVDVLSVPTPAANSVYTLDLGGGYGPQNFNTGNTAPSAFTLLSNILSLNQINFGPNIISAVVTGTGNSAVLTITANGPGQYVASSNFTTTVQTPGGSIASDLASIAAVDNTWYGLCISNASDADILAAASWVEANSKMFFASSASAPVATGVTTDVASSLNAGGYTRTVLLYNPASVTQGAEAAWLGSLLALTPGSYNPAYKTLNGITADTLTDTALSNLIGVPTAGTTGKNANVYVPIGGNNVTLMGTAASGKYMDITVGTDWLRAQIQTNVYTALSSVAKVPYTDAGTTVLINQVKAALTLGVTNGLIDGSTPITVTAPAVATVPVSQRASRTAPTITFTARLQGAFNSVTIQGQLSV